MRLGRFLRRMIFWWNFFRSRLLKYKIPQNQRFLAKSAKTAPPTPDSQPKRPENRFYRKSALDKLFLCVWRGFCEEWFFGEIFAEKALGNWKVPIFAVFHFSYSAPPSTRILTKQQLKKKNSKIFLDSLTSSGHFGTDLSKIGSFLSELDDFAYTSHLADFRWIFPLRQICGQVGLTWL